MANNPTQESLDLVYSLIEALGERYTELKILVAWCSVTYGIGEEWPLEVREFVKAISKNSPACAIFHNSNELLQLCKRLIEGFPIKRYPNELQILHNNCPLLFKFFCVVNGDSLPEDVIPIINKLLRIAALPFQNQPFVNDSLTPHDNIYSQLSFYPHHPVIRGRDNYTLDHEKKDKNSFICTKRHGRHPTLLPGIFLIQCRHGKKIE